MVGGRKRRADKKRTARRITLSHEGSGARRFDQTETIKGYPSKIINALVIHDLRGAMYPRVISNGAVELLRDTFFRRFH